MNHMAGICVALSSGLKPSGWCIPAYCFHIKSNPVLGGNPECYSVRWVYLVVMSDVIQHTSRECVEGSVTFKHIYLTEHDE